MAPSQFGLFANSTVSGGTPDLQFHIQPLVSETLKTCVSIYQQCCPMTDLLYLFSGHVVR
jgi:hypothetical protein